MAIQDVAPDTIFKDIKLKGFKVHRISGTVNPTHAHGRRDFYKIVLVSGDLTVHYGEERVDIKDTFLFFANPHVPHNAIHHSTENKGYAVLFTEAFMAGRGRMEMLQRSPLFRVNDSPIIPLNKEQRAFLTSIFEKMLSVHSDEYDYREELLRNCIELIIHQALQIQPLQQETQQKNAATRITTLFLELLERQFPVESPVNPLSLRTAQDFAGELAVHVNYLNRSVKEITGKPTSTHIAERIVTEAKALLQHSNWSVADIAYGLGFEYPTYFNNYFKRVTGNTPNSFRKG